MTMDRVTLVRMTMNMLMMIMIGVSSCLLYTSCSS